MRSEIRIPRSDGAEIFANQGGGITIKQSGWADEAIISLTVGEGRQMAAALHEIADFLDSEQSEGK